MSPRVKGLLVGGVLGGILTIIPFVNLGNCLCCLWIVLGGFLASAIHVKGSETAVSKGDGAITGLLAGVPMLIVYIVIGIPIAVLTGPLIMGIMSQVIDDPSFQSQLGQMMGQSIVQNIISAVVGAFMYAFLFAGFGALGGLIGTAIFEHREPALPQGPQGGPPIAPAPPPYAA